MNPHIADEIIPGLWLGSRHVRLANPEFMESVVTHVVDASNKRMPQLDDTIPILHVELTDSAYSILPFQEVSNFIDNALASSASDGNQDDGVVGVLVHCNQGMSRSAALIMGYLMICKGFTLKQAFFHVKQRRRMILPNAGFMKQLIELEASLHHGTTTLELGFGGTLKWKQAGRTENRESVGNATHTTTITQR